MNKITDFPPDISVIVPVYRAEQYIDRCVRSILDQSKSNIEVYLVDDGSPDKSGEICDRLSKQDSRITVIHTKNMGVSAARNVGMALAQGKYISFIDADDYIEHTMLSHLYHEAEKCGADIAICGYFVDINTTQQVVNVCCEDGIYDYISINRIYQKFFEADYAGLASMWNKLYRRDFLKKNNLFVDTALRRAEDFWFNIKAIEKSSKITVSSIPLYHYVQHSESVMHYHDIHLFEHWTNNRKKLLSEAVDNNITINDNLFFYNYIYNCILLLREMTKKNRFKDALKIIKDSFFISSLRFYSEMPVHIKTIAFLIKHKFCFSALIILKIWSLIHNGQ